MTWPYRTARVSRRAKQVNETCWDGPFTKAFAGIANELPHSRARNKIPLIINDLRCHDAARGRLARFLLNGDRAQKNAHLQIQLPLGASP
jgi:hypothetical protein